MQLRTCSLAVAAMLGAGLLPANAQQDSTRIARPEQTEVWTPVPRIVAPGKTDRDAPADATILFGGTSLSEWVAVTDSSPAKWDVANGVLTVKKSAGDIRTRRTFGSYQMHLEWRIPPEVSGSGQLRGNSGVFLAFTPEGGYELQILDSYENSTYVNGQAGSLYKQAIPLVNAMRKPSEWQTYDVVWTAPTFNANGTLRTPAYVTALHNGVLVQNHFEMAGVTKFTGRPEYKAHGAAPIMLQAHGDPSPPISFRNIWVRELR